jgi:hypothetical protein
MVAMPLAASYVLLGLGDFNILLPQDELAAVQQVDEAQPPEAYPLIKLPQEMTDGARFYALFNHLSQPFSVACQRLELLPADSPLKFQAVPAACYNGKPPFSALCLVNEQLVCVSSTEQLLALSEAS